MMMIQVHPLLPHMEERLLSFTLLSYGGTEKVLQIMKIRGKKSMREQMEGYCGKFNQR